MNKIIFSAITLILLAFGAEAQSVSGKIITSEGSPAANVNIELQDLRLFTVTNEQGEFSFNNIKPGSYTIVASYAGLQTRTFSFKMENLPVNATLTLIENAQQLEEVIIRSKQGLNGTPVSVGKVAINPMDLPQSISVINESVIRDQQSQRLSDVVKNVNGVYLSTTRGSTQESFSARGYGMGSGNLFKNGSRVNAGVMPEMSSLEKVEVLKGSAAILFGNVAPGGIINMVTRQPKFKKGGEFSLRSGSNGLIKPSLDYYGPISTKIAFRINGTYESADSYRDNVSSERFYINPSMLFKLNKRTELLLQADYLNHEFTPDFGIGSINGTKISPLGRSTFLGTPWQYNKADQITATATLKHKLNDKWTLNTTGSYQLYKRDYYSTERIQALANGDWGRPLNRIESREDYGMLQVDVNGKFNTGRVSHNLLAGIDADRYYTTTYSFDNPTFYDSINILNPDKFVARMDIPAASKIKSVETPVYRTGFYIQDLISVSDKLKILAGIRYSQQNSRPATSTFLKNDSTSVAASKNDDAFTPRLGVVYKILPTMSAFASYANSFSINNGTDVFGNALDASLIDQFELGIKNEFYNGRLSVNLTAYKIINNNLAQTAQFAADGVTPNNNTALKELVGQTTSNGIELDVMGNPVKGLNIVAGYSYNDMRYTKTDELKGNYVEGQRLVNTPAHTANASAFYTITKGDVKGLKLGIGAYYVGERMGGWNNTYQQTQADRLIPVDGFTTVDLSAGYGYGKFSVMAKVSNLFNAFNYYLHENYSVNPIAPRQYAATLTYKF